VRLRTDIHVAFDEISPNRYALADRVVRTLVTERSRRATRGFWAPRLRSLTVAAAVVMLGVTAVGVLVGGRLYRDWNGFANRDGSAIAALEARPLHLPTLGPGDACPIGPITSLQGVGSGEAFGDGPVIAMPIEPDHQTGWGSYGYQWLLVRRDVTGLVLVRGKDLVSGEALVFVGTFATGPTTGEDTDKDGFPVKQHDEGYLDASHPPQDTNLPEVSFAGADRFFAWQMSVALPAGAAGCVAYQVDGADFTEVFVISSQ
jgi:hypothetical protein